MRRATSRSRATGTRASERNRPSPPGSSLSATGRPGPKTPGRRPLRFLRLNPHREPGTSRGRHPGRDSAAANWPVSPIDDRLRRPARRIDPQTHGVRGVTEARENVNLETPGSTPAEYP